MSDNEDGDDGKVEEEERVTAHSYGALDIRHVEDECWLIRVPQKLAEVWENAPTGTVLGELVFKKGGTVATNTTNKPTGTTTATASNSIKPAPNGKTGEVIKPSLDIHVKEGLVEEVWEIMQQKQRQKELDEEDPEADEPVTAASQAAAAAAALAKKDPLQPPPPPTVALHYTLQAMTKKIPVLHPFSRHPKTGSINLWGTVTRTANMEVQRQDTTYRAMVKDRLVNSSIISNRYVKPFEATESVMNRQRSTAGRAAAAQSTKTNSFGNAVFQYGKRVLESSQDSYLQGGAMGAAGGGAGNNSGNKKAKQFSADQSMRSVVFELFSRQQYWTVKDLKAAAVAGGLTSASTKRAEAEIREILREIGDYHRSGDHKNMWELRK